MPKQYLITQSLLNAWNYTFECADEYADEARKDLFRMLKREPSETTEAMQNGIDFENEVYAEAAHTARAPHPAWESGIRKVAQIIEGAPVQVKASRELDVAGMSFLVYGVLDALKLGTIYDVKFSSKPLSSYDAYGKYLFSAQHPTYFYLVPEANEFTYLVSDGSDLYIESYTRNRTRFIGDIIENFVEYLDDTGLLRLYMQHWQAL